MREVVIFIALFSLLGSVSAYDVMGSGDSYLKREIDLELYDVSPLEIKKSIIDVMIKNNWVITEQSKDHLIGVYDGRAKVKATIEKDRVILSEVPSSADFNKRWMRSLHGHIVNRLLYFHHVRQANRLL